MRKNNRPEEFFIFNGEDAEGRKLSYENQFRIFRRAVLVLGPHGSGVCVVCVLCVVWVSLKTNISISDDFTPSSSRMDEYQLISY
jgi:hypothetical protein